MIKTTRNDAGYKMQDAGCRMQDAGYRFLVKICGIL